MATIPNIAKKIQNGTTGTTIILKALKTINDNNDNAPKVNGIDNITPKNNTTQYTNINEHAFLISEIPNTFINETNLVDSETIIIVIKIIIINNVGIKQIIIINSN